MQPAQLAYQLMPRPQIKMISIAEQNLAPELMQIPRQHRLHRTLRPHRHEARGFDHTMSRHQTAEAGFRVQVLLEKSEMISHNNFGFEVARRFEADRNPQEFGFNASRLIANLNAKFLKNQHRVAITVKSILPLDRLTIGPPHQIETGKCGDQNQRRRPGQMKIGDQRVEHAKLIAGSHI